MLSGLSRLYRFQLSSQLCDGLFGMAYPLLNLARSLFGVPFRFQSAVISSLTDLLLDSALYLVEAAFDLVFRTGLHVSPYAFGKLGLRICGSFF
jgi:hypothetical protein